MDESIKRQVRKHFEPFEQHSYHKGEILILANQEPKGVSLLLEGVVEQFDITPEGKKIVVNIYKPPAFFPMSWAINNTPNTYLYGALTDVILKRAPARETLAFLRASPDVLFDLLSRVYKGTDALLRRLAIASSGIAESRLIFELLLESYRFGEDGGGTKRTIHIRQTVLADRSGLARETVSRELRKLEDDKLLTRTAGGMIVDIGQLEARLDITV